MRIALVLAMILLLVAPATEPPTEPPTERPCTDLEKRTGKCPPSGVIREGYVELADSTSTSNRSGGTSEQRATEPPAPATPPATPCPVGRFGCDPRDDYTVITVTLSDIARFRPAPGIQRMQPDGWVVVGLPANIYSITDTQIVPGELLGQPADVRFTPTAWQWNYGDGTTATLPTRGGTWHALGLHEFDPTPTSHTYQQPGSYTIRLNIVYRAEYRIAGSPFTPIAGTLTLPANELHITATGAKTVLVDRDCTQLPRGPGC